MPVVYLTAATIALFALQTPLFKQRLGKDMSLNDFPDVIVDCKQALFFESPADIQQTLAYGAHGPEELIVLLLDDQVTD